MQELQELIPVIYMDVVYAGIAGARFLPAHPSLNNVNFIIFTFLHFRVMFDF